MGQDLLPERRQLEVVTTTIAKPQGGNREVSPKEADSKDTTIGTRTGSEAGCGRWVC